MFFLLPPQFNLHLKLCFCLLGAPRCGALSNHDRCLGRVWCNATFILSCKARWVIIIVSYILELNTECTFDFTHVPLSWPFFLFWPLTVWSNLLPKSYQSVYVYSSLSECSKITLTPKKQTNKNQNLWLDTWTYSGWISCYQTSVRIFRHSTGDPLMKGIIIAKYKPSNGFSTTLLYPVLTKQNWS